MEISTRGGGQHGSFSTWGHLKPPLSWKNHVTAKISRVVADISCVAADILCVAADILRVAADWKFFGIFNGENTLFSKSAQKMV